MDTDVDESLWLVCGIVPAFKIDQVGRALEELREFKGMTISECERYQLALERRDGGGEALEVSAPLARRDEPMRRVEIPVRGHETARRMAETISIAAHTGRGDDGEVWITRLDLILSNTSVRINWDALR